SRSPPTTRRSSSSMATGAARTRTTSACACANLRPGRRATASGSSTTADRSRAARTEPSAVHQRGEALEQIEGVVRAGGGFGVVLDAEGSQIFRREAFARAVVQVDVRRDDALREGIEIDAEAVVLRGDLDLAGREILHRLVRAAMAELQLVRL